MKRIMTIGFLMAMFGILSLVGCHGGGGGGTPAPQPTTAVLTLISQGTNTQIYGIEVTLQLPTGVSVETALSSSETATGVVAASGVAASNSIVTGNYTAPAGTVHIVLANFDGFGTGEFVIVNCDIAAGSHPVAADFVLSNFVAKDVDGIVINGLTPGLTADIH